MKKTLNYLQYLVFPFTFLAIYYIISGTYFDRNINDVGFGVLNMGIAFGFSSMGDISKISDKEIRLFESKKRFRRQVWFLTALGVLMIFTSLFFISMKWILKPEAGQESYMLGLNCFPLVISSFFSLKQQFDKKDFYELSKMQKGIIQEKEVLEETE